MTDGKLVAISQGDALYGSLGGSSTGAFGRTKIAPEIQALADSIKLLAENSSGVVVPDQYLAHAYAFVKSEVAPEFRFGLAKGSLGAYLDKSGTPFDQAQLLKELLGVQGISANYIFGKASLTAAQFIDWTGISTAREACKLFANGGIPAQINGASPADCNITGAVSSITFSHVWLSVNAGQTFLVDPSFKSMTYKSPIQNLDVLTGFSRTSFSSSANLSDGNVNPSGLNTKLNSLATTYYQTVKANYAQQSTIDVLGGEQIAYKEIAPSTSALMLPYQGAGLTTSASMPDKLRTKLTFTYLVNPSLSLAEQSFIFFADSTYGSVISFSTLSHPNTYYHSSGTVRCAMNFSSGEEKSEVNVRWFASNPVSIKVDHPYLASNETNIANTYMDSESKFTLNCRLPNVLVQGFGVAGEGLVKTLKERALEKRETAALSASPSGSPSFSDLTNGWQSVIQTGPTFLFEQSQRTKFVAGISKAIIENHHTVGLVSQPAKIDINGSSPATVTQQSLELSLDTAMSFAPREFSSAVYPDDVETVSDELINQAGCTWQLNYSQGGILAVYAYSCGALTKTITYSGSTQTCTLAAGSSGGSSYRVTGTCNSFQLWKKAATPVVSTAYPGTPSRSGVGRALSWLLSSLEGEVIQKISGGVEAYSTAHRFAWGIGKTNFGVYAGVGTSIVKPKPTIFLSPDPASIFINLDIDANSIANAMVSTGNTYLNQGYKVVMPNLAVMGPGELAWSKNQNPCTSQFCTPNFTYTANLGSLYGSAFYVENVAKGDFTHVMLDNYGSNRGGGSGTRGAPTLDGGKLEAPKPDSRQKLEHGVQKNTGDVGYTFNSVLSVGGEFPYGLSANINVKTRKGEPEYTATLQPISNNGSWSRVQRAFDVSETGSVSFESDGVNLLGKRSPLEAAYAVAAVVALLDSSHSGSGNMHLYNALIAKWFADQTLESTASVTSPRGSDELVRHADGFYYSKPGSPVKTSVTINKSIVVPVSSSYCDNSNPPNPSNIEWLSSGRARVVTATLVRTLKNGDKETFAPKSYTTSRWDCGPKNPWHPLVSYDNNKGVTVAYTYDNFKQLTEIKNNLGRTLTFTHSGNPTTGYSLNISDGSGRSAVVTEVIDTSVTPVSAVKVQMPEGKIWTAKFANPVQTGKAPLYGQALDAIFGPEDSVNPIIKYGYDSLWQAKSVNLLKTGSTYWNNAYRWGVLPGYASLEVDASASKSVDYLDDAGNIFYQLNPADTGTLTQYNHWNQVIDQRVFSASYLFKTLAVDSPKWTGTLTNYDKFESKKTFVYDNNSNPTKETLWAAPGKQNASSSPLHINRTWHQTFNELLTESFRYQDGGSPVTAITNSYDGITGNITSSTTAEGLVTNYTNYWNGLPRLVTEGSSSAVIRRKVFVFDSYANLTSYTISKADGSIPITTLAGYTDPAYGNLGDVVSLTDPRGNRTTATYFPNRKLKTMTNPIGVVSTYAYTGSGYLNSIVTLGAQGKRLQTTATYNPLGWMMSLSDTASDTQYFEYDARGLLETLTDPLNRKTRYSYDKLGKLSCQRDGWGSPLERTYKHLQYDALGNITAYNSADSDPDHNCSLNSTTKQTRLEYDAFGQLWKTTFPSTPENGSTFESLDYWASGAVKTKTTRRGDLINYTYKNSNAHAKLVDTKKVGTGTAPGYLVSYTYDVFGKPTAITQTGASANTLGFVYDFADRGVTSASQKIGSGINRTLLADYDSAGNRTKLTWPDSYVIDYSYSTINTLDQVKNGTKVLADYSDDELGRTKTISYGNGVSTSLDYENDGDLDFISHSFVGGANNLRMDYNYNASAQLTQNSLSNGHYHWRSASTQTQAYATNSLNQYTSVGGVGLMYDKAGNLTKGKNGTFVYDAENKLTQAVMTSGNPTGALTANYAYDANGRRTQKSVGSTITEFLSEGDHEIAEYNGNSSTTVTRYIYGKGVDELIAIHAVSANTYQYAHRNHQGSVIAVSNNSGQVTTDKMFTYSAYGETRTAASTAPTIPFLYTGRRLDNETGLYYYRARYYDPVMGRFLQTDPIGYKDQMNLYAYVHNDPVNMVDPTGEIAFLIPVLIIAAKFAVGAGFEVAMQMASGTELSDINISDVVVAGAVSATIPGMGNLAMKTFSSAKTIASSTKAAAKVSEKSANTANRADKNARSIEKHGAQIKGAATEVVKAAAAAGVHQGVKAVAKEVAPDVSASEMGGSSNDNRSKDEQQK